MRPLLHRCRRVVLYTSVDVHGKQFYVSRPIALSHRGHPYAAIARIAFRPAGIIRDRV